MAEKIDKNGRVQMFIESVKKEFGVVMLNPTKVDRVVFGIPTNKGLVGGVGEEASPEVILAKYDQMQGAVMREGFKVKPGTFCDKNGNPAKKPIVYLVKMNGEYVEHEEGTPESIELQVAKKQAKAKKVKKEE